MQITVEMIDTKEFKIKPRGYDQQEVDDFLDAIGDEMVRQLDTIQSLQQQLQQAKAARPQPEAPTQVLKPVQPKPAPASAPASDSFREILEMAQKVKDETIAEAQRKADAIVDEANAQASARLSSLEKEKDALTREVAALKAAASEYRAKFEALLQAQQEAMEKAADLF